jgi:hypothetical protein
MSDDVAVPMPERKIGTVRAAAVAVDTKLTDDQLRRVEALQVARQTLENKAGLFAGSKVEAHRAVYDLTYLADWIIDGPGAYASEDVPEDAPTAAEQGYQQNRAGLWEPIPNHDAAATADLTAARSDVDDGV